ncbi:MAG: TIGR02679 domain-containing protein [Solirubrobacteraceae bacterium]
MVARSHRRPTLSDGVNPGEPAPGAAQGHLKSQLHGGGLAEAVVELTGQVVVVADVTAAKARGWKDAFARASSACSGRPALDQWLERVRASGVAKRLASGSFETGPELLDGVAAVVAAGTRRRAGAGRARAARTRRVRRRGAARGMVCGRRVV